MTSSIYVHRVVYVRRLNRDFIAFKKGQLFNVRLRRFFARNTRNSCKLLATMDEYSRFPLCFPRPDMLSSTVIKF